MVKNSANEHSEGGGSGRAGRLTESRKSRIERQFELLNPRKKFSVPSNAELRKTYGYSGKRTSDLQRQYYDHVEAENGFLKRSNASKRKFARRDQEAVTDAFNRRNGLAMRNRLSALQNTLASKVRQTVVNTAAGERAHQETRYTVPLKDQLLVHGSKLQDFARKNARSGDRHPSDHQDVYVPAVQIVGALRAKIENQVNAALRKYPRIKVAPVMQLRFAKRTPEGLEHVHEVYVRCKVPISLSRGADLQTQLIDPLLGRIEQEQAEGKSHATDSVYAGMSRLDLNIFPVDHHRARGKTMEGKLSTIIFSSHSIADVMEVAQEDRGGDDKCFMYAVTLALFYDELKKAYGYNATRAANVAKLFHRIEWCGIDTHIETHQGLSLEFLAQDDAAVARRFCDANSVALRIFKIEEEEETSKRYDDVVLHVKPTSAAPACTYANILLLTSAETRKRTKKQNKMRKDPRTRRIGRATWSPSRT